MHTRTVAIPISIHASLAGGDATLENLRLLLMISIHASLAGGDVWLWLYHIIDMISIHASLAGGDPLPRVRREGPPHFNPRLPRGRRRDENAVIRALVHISIHASLAGGDTTKPSRPGERPGISIHASLAGGDFSPLLFDSSLRFQSTPPSREATRFDLRHMRRRLISIHASLAGGDFLQGIDR